MAQDDKQLMREVSRWLRVGTLTVSTFGPLVSTLLTRTREPRTDAYTLPRNQRVEVIEPKEVHVEIQPSLADSLVDLKDRISNQELVKQAQELGQELLNRSTRLSQMLAERGTDLTQDLVGRGGKATDDLRKQTNKASKRLRKNTKKATKVLSKRSEAITRNFQKKNNNNLFWIVFGFSVGLTAVGSLIYIFLRNKPQQLQEEDQQILLSQNGNIPVSPSPVAAGVATATSPVTGSGTGTSMQSSSFTQSSPTMASTPLSSTSLAGAIPADAVYVGVVNTKQYYPVQTPLDQLSTTGKILDVVYFSTEDEARAQGFTPAP